MVHQFTISVFLLVDIWIAAEAAKEIHAVAAMSMMVAPDQ